MIGCIFIKAYALYQATGLEPWLKDIPLITLTKGKVEQVSKLAFEQGVRSGMSLEGARAYASNLKVIDTNEQTLAQAWDGFLNELYAFSDRIESPKPGLVFIDLEQADAEIIRQVYNLEVAFGDSQEEARLRALALSESITADLNQLPLNLLKHLGFKDQTTQRLAWLGLENLGQLKRWSKAQLELFLEEDAKIVIRYLKGPWRKEVALYKPSVKLSANFQFDEPVLEPYRLEPVMHHLASGLVTQLEGRTASRLTLKVEVAGLSFNATRIAKQALKDDKTIYALTDLAFKDSGAKGLEVEAISLELSGIYRPISQGSLWHQRESVDKAIQAVSQRFPGQLFHYHEVNPYTPLANFAYKTITLGQKGDKSESGLSYRSQPQQRQTQQCQRATGIANP